MTTGSSGWRVSKTIVLASGPAKACHRAPSGDGSSSGSSGRIVEVLLGEHDEDLARLGGDLASTSSARHATWEPIKVRLGHRLPWLRLGLLGAVASAHLLDAFGRELERDMLIAFVVPGVVYMADAIGTQTEALVIRGLSVGVSIGRILAVSC